MGSLPENSRHKPTARSLCIDPELASAILNPSLGSPPETSRITTRASFSNPQNGTELSHNQADVHAGTLPNRLRSQSTAFVRPGLQSASSSHRRQHTSPQRSQGITSLIAQDVATSPVEANGADFLVLLARQERKVMELRVELAKAEQVLSEMKKSWTVETANRRKKQSRPAQSMRPLSTASADFGVHSTLPDASSSAQFVRHRASVSHTRAPSRRVFSNSRHARTLSLVPARQATGQNPRDHDGQADAFTFPATQNIESSNDTTRKPLMEQGRQLASDFGDGLWTLLGDLRHAASGEDARSSKPVSALSGMPVDRRNSAVARSDEAAVMARPSDTSPCTQESENKDKSFWEEFGVLEDSRGKPAASSALSSAHSPETPGKVILKPTEVDGEIWETWDTPQRAPSSVSNSSRFDSPRDSVSSATEGSPDTRTSGDDDEALTAQRRPRRDERPLRWPALSEHAGSLRKTASYLMEEWERSVQSSMPLSSDSALRQSGIL